MTDHAPHPYGRGTHVTIKDGRHWASREDWTVVDSRRNPQTHRLEYLLARAPLPPEWHDWAEVDGPSQEELDLWRRLGIDGTGAPNLDSMTEAELVAFHREVQTGPILVARGLFPARPSGYGTATRLLAAYADNKRTAMQCRIRGDIEAAVVYEIICEQIYAKLPAFARW
jgi:hypothetical protein